MSLKSYNSYLLSKLWKKIRQKYKKRYCECCGSKNNLQLHHREYSVRKGADFQERIDFAKSIDPSYEFSPHYCFGVEREDQLITVCTACHLRLHRIMSEFSNIKKEIKNLRREMEARIDSLGTLLLNTPLAKKKDRDEIARAISDFKKKQQSCVMILWVMLSKAQRIKPGNETRLKYIERLMQLQSEK